MKRVHLEKSSKCPNFIGSWFIDPPSLCDGIIKFFENNPALHKRGSSGAGNPNDDVKKSTDLSVRPIETEQKSHAVLKDYLSCLYDCYLDYLEIWPFLKKGPLRLEMGTFNIQRYLHGDHFQQMHAERTNLGDCHRVLAWMTYLNTVSDGGSTSFLHYDIDIKPEQGRTLIWPADWTHAHCGNIINSGTKYIITGWLHFPDSA